jgi:hypothetical protein
VRARVAILFALGTLGFVLAASALADSVSTDPPTQISPANGSPFTAPADGIVFQASVPLIPTPPSHMDFFISRGTDTDPTTGVLSPHIDDIQAGTSDATTDPVIYAASPGADVNWPDRPGTYYWQASYHDCNQSIAPDCENQSPQSPNPPPSFTINPRPASTVGPGNEPKTFLDKHPRHRTHNRRVRFAFSSDVAGAHFQCLFAQGWAKCRSPHVFRHLKPGRYKFKARAVVNGVKDPTPASWVFKVLR